MKKVILFLIIFIGLTVSHFSSTLAREREGVDVPFNITANYKSGITDGQFLLYAYQVILNRTPDDGGAMANMAVLDSNTNRQTIFNNLMASTEFTGNNSLNNNSNYVGRLYTYIFKRQADAGGLQVNLNQLNTWQNQLGQATAWYYIFNAFLELPEFKIRNCQTQAYSYGQKVNADAPSLTDLFAGTARFQTPSEAERIGLNFSSLSNVNYPLSLAKVPVLKIGNGYIGFSRVFFSDTGKSDIAMFTSPDGISFSQAKRIFGSRDQNLSPYDPHIAEDYSYCPARYVLTTECGGGLCVSESSSPEYTWSWTKPKMIVSTNMIDGRYISASTGTSITAKDGRRYVYWTVIDDGKIYFQWPGQPQTPDEGDESAYIKGAEMTSPNWTSTQVGGTLLMAAEKNVHCTSSWDCNNKDKQDTKYEDGKYYQIYNGANYYRCERPIKGVAGTDFYKLTNTWGLSIARSSSPLGNFDADRLPPIITAERTDLCATSYPVINNVNGELYMYYDYIWPDGRNWILRSKLVWKTSTNISGLRQLLSAFTNIFDYNQLAKDFGK